MPFLTVGYDQFRKVVGTGIKNNLSVVWFPTLIATITKIVKAKLVYLNQKKLNSGNIFSTLSSLNQLGGDAVEISKILALTTIPLLRDLFSLVKNVSYPSEGFDVLSNSYWTRKTGGKVNLNPLTFSFTIDDRYKIYDVMNFIKDGVLLDKEHGVYNYPENYFIDEVVIATFTPTVYKNKDGLLGINNPISVKHYYNCFLNNVGEVSKDTSSKDTLEEFTVNIEYEYTKSNTSLDLPDIAIANTNYILKQSKGLQNIE